MTTCLVFVSYLSFSKTNSLESISYQSIDLPHNATDFIALHDQEDVGLADKPIQDIIT